MYFRDQGDSLTKAVMVNTQKPAERRERERQTIKDTEWGEGPQYESSIVTKDKSDVIC